MSNLPKKPEDWLEVASPGEKAKGGFKLFLGYAPGVGKTYSMLSEAIRRHARGEDIVIALSNRMAARALKSLPRSSNPSRAAKSNTKHHIRRDGSGRNSCSQTCRRSG